MSNTDAVITAYLCWEKRGPLWSAKDPIQDDRRWIIGKIDKSNNYYLAWVKDGVEHKVQRPQDNIIILMWQAVSIRLYDIASTVFTAQFKVSHEELEKMSEFLKMIGNSYQHYQHIQSFRT